MIKWLVSVTLFGVLTAPLACSDETAFTNNDGSTFAFGVSRRNWFYSSAPVGYKGGNQGTPSDRDRGELLWFSPNTVQVADINPTEDSEAARNDPVPVLEIIYIPSDSAGGQLSWGGLVHGLGQQGGDISGMEYLEVWLNDHIPYELASARRGELYIDVGQVSEDGIWDPQTPPLPRNGLLDLEDRNLNGGQVEPVEDLGLDFLSNPYEPPRRPGTKAFSPFSPTQDPSGDDRVSDVVEEAPENTIAQRINSSEESTALRSINGSIPRT